MKNLIIVIAGLFCVGACAQNTFLIKDIAPGADSSNPYDLKDHGGELYFLTYTNSSQSLYKTDGTEEGTIEVISGMDYASEYHIASNNQIFISAAFPGDSEEELYVHSGIVGAVPTKITINPSSPSRPAYFKESNGRVYFFAKINSSPLQWQIASIDISSHLINSHIAPAPFNGHIIVNGGRNQRITGFAGLVPIGSDLVYSVSGPSGSALVKLDTGNATASPIVIASGVNNNTRDGLYAYNNKVYFNHSGELKCSDGNTVTTIGSGLNPYYFMEFSGKLFFAGVSSANSGHSVLYQLDVSNTVTEFGNIRAEGAIGNTQGARNYSIRKFDNKLFVFINEFPTTSYYNFCEIDFTNPSVPTYAIVLDEHPAAMYDLAYAHGHFYYGIYSGNANVYEFKKKNQSFSTVICNVAADQSTFNITPFNNEIYYTYKGPESINCNIYGNVGLELHKLTQSQIDCNTTVTIPASNLVGFEGIFAANQTLNLTGNVVLNQDRCILFSTININLSGLFQVTPPQQLGLIIQGCP